MSINSYTELKAAIADWINRDDLTDERLGDFVQLAETRIFRDLRVPTMERYVNLTTDSQGRVTLPAGYLEAKNVFFNDKTLSRISLSQFFTYTPLEGTPEFFTRETLYLRVWPTPPAGTAGLKMVYFIEPPRLSATVATNSVFNMAPELYLYGSLIAAGIYLGSPPEKLALWSQSFDDAMSRITRQAILDETSGATPTVLSGY